MEQAGLPGCAEGDGEIGRIDLGITGAGLEAGAPDAAAPGANAALPRGTVWGGVWAVVLVALMGNLSGILQVVEQFARAGGAAFAENVATWADLGRVLPGMVGVMRGTAQLPGFDYWYRATRVIPFTINEFPFFSFLFADLHPHMIGIPFTVLAIGLLLALAQDDGADRPGTVLRGLALAVTIGALGVINTWDLPTSLGLMAVALLYRGYRRQGWRGVATAFAGVAAIALGALLLYAPFYSHYQAQSLGLGLVTAEQRSPLVYFAVIWGALLFLAASLVVGWLVRGLSDERLARVSARMGRRAAFCRLWALRGGGLWGRVWGVIMLLLGGALGVALGYIGQPLLGLLAVLIVMAAVALAWGAARSPGVFFRRLLLLTGVALLLGVELLYVKDFLSGGDWSRMNTLFKFYIQAWVLLGLAVGSALPRLWARAGRPAWLATPWRAIAGLLLAGSLVYTVVAVPVRLNERFPGAWPPRNTLDGTAYMTTGVYYWPDADSPIDLRYDREAIAWLWEHVEGTPVLAEAAISYYREGGLRVSSYTGLPTILGMHEREQRPWDVVSPRETDAARLYNTTDSATLFEVLARHRVRYIYVGQLERRIYDAAGVDKFADLAARGLLERVYANERVEIYQVLQDWDIQAES